MANIKRNMRAGAAVVLVSLTLAACGGEGDAKKAEAKAGEKAGGGASSQTVSVVTASLQNLPRTVTASGTVTAWEEVPVGAETGPR